MNRGKAVGLATVVGGVAYVAKRYGGLVKIANVGRRVIAVVGGTADQVQEVPGQVIQVPKVATSKIVDAGEHLTEATGAASKQVQGAAENVVKGTAKLSGLRERLRRKQR